MRMTLVVSGVLAVVALSSVGAKRSVLPARVFEQPANANSNAEQAAPQPAPTALQAGEHSLVHRLLAYQVGNYDFSATSIAEDGTNSPAIAWRGQRELTPGRTFLLETRTRMDSPSTSVKASAAKSFALWGYDTARQALTLTQWSSDDPRQRSFSAPLTLDSLPEQGVAGLSLTLRMNGELAMDSGAQLVHCADLTIAKGRITRVEYALGLGQDISRPYLRVDCLRKDAAMPNPLHALMMAQRAEQHQQLDSLVGEWDVAVKAFPPGLPVIAFNARSSVRWVLNKLYLEDRLTFSNLLGEGEAMTFISFDLAEKRYQLAVLNSQNSQMAYATGDWESATKTLTFTGTMFDLATQQPMPSRTVMDHSKPDKRVVDVFIDYGDGYQRALNYEFTRRKD